jgi:hypothetical protein
MPPDPPGAAAARGTSLPPAELLVLSGSTTGDDATGQRVSYGGKPIPQGGCAGKARRDVTGVDQIDPERAADAITVAMFEKSKADPRVAAAVRSWSGCMKDSGYHYQSPLQAGGDHPEWLRQARAGAAEIQTAVTDVRCKQRTNLIGIWFGVESAYENAAIQQHIEQLTDVRNRWRAAARTAAGVLGVPVPRS